MATRLRSFARNSWVKAASFLLCVALTVGAVSVVIWIGQTNWRDDYMYNSSLDYFDYLTLGDFYSSWLMRGRLSYIEDTVLEACGWTVRDTATVTENQEENFEKLGAMEGVYYWVSTKHMVLSNTEPDENFFKSQKFSVIVVGNKIRHSSFIELNHAISYPFSVYGTDLYLCIDDAVVEAWEDEYNAKRSEAWGYIGLVCLMALLSILLLVHLAVTAGRRPEDGEVRMRWLDRVWWEVLIGAIILIVSVALAIVENTGSVLLESPLIYWVCLIPFALCYMLFIELVLSVSKRIKRRELWKGSLCLILLHAVWVAVKRVCKAVWAAVGSFCAAFASSMPLSILAAGSVLIFALLNAAAYRTPLPVFFTIAAMAGAVWWINGLSKIIRGVGEVKAGKLDTVITLKGNGRLTRLAGDINGISEGLQARVESELRAERMKTELITNVSHDLRTPLTSVLTYVDLLKTEGLDSPDAPRYLEVVEQKSARLKQLTDDLFEAAKASSGSISPAFEGIELRELVDQSLGELSGKIEESGLDFRVTGENVRVRADGRMLWRCLENLLGNIFKYAFPNSRVYVTIDSRDGLGRLTIKNISAYELGMDASELTERFTRGDASRGGEGSGLGLAIVKDFVRLQNGSFDIETDGDLFKTIIALPLADGGR